MNTDDDTLTITLLGTGIPNPDINAFGTSTLIEAGGERVMIDCGRGTVIRMAEMGFPVGFIDTLILSHYHSDHYAGVFDLLMTGTIQQPFAGRGGPLKIIGPPGVEDIAEGAWLATRPDREIRVADSEIDPEHMRVIPEVYESEGVVYDKGGQLSASKACHRSSCVTGRCWASVCSNPTETCDAHTSCIVAARSDAYNCCFIRNIDKL